MASQKNSGSVIQHLQVVDVSKITTKFLKDTAEPKAPRRYHVFFILIRVCWATRVAKIEPEESPVPTWHWYEFKNTSTSSSKGCPECKRASGEPSPSFRCQKSASQTLTLSSVRIPLSITGPLSTDQIPSIRNHLNYMYIYIYVCLICIICVRKNMYIYIYVCVMSKTYIYIYLHYTSIV